MPSPTPCPNPGVLTNCSQSTLQGYAQAIINDNIGYIFTIALIMIIYSGVEYMYSGFSPDKQKSAKQRIIGIITGLVFFLLLQVILNQITDIKGLPTVRSH